MASRRYLVQLLYNSVREQATLEKAFHPLLQPQQSDIDVQLANTSQVAADFNASLYYQALQTRSLGRVLFVAATLPSTQTFLEQYDSTSSSVQPDHTCLT